jgi:MFS family permease
MAGVRRPGVLLVLFAFINVLAYADRSVLAAVLPRIEEHFGLSHAVGGLLGTLFLAGYFLGSPVVGVLADRGYARSLVAGGAAVWSLGTIACGAAPGIAWLSAGRVLVGAAEATVGTIGPAAIDAVAPAGRRGAWLGFFYVAAHVGAALGLALGGLVERYAGWRTAFVAVGAPGVALAALSLCIGRDVATSRVGRPPGAVQIRDLARSSRYVRTVAGYCAYTFAIGGFAHWAPELVVRRFHVDLAVANVGLGAAGLTGGLAGTALGGVLGDRLARGSNLASSSALVRVCAFACTLAAPLGAAAILAPSLALMLVLLFACQLALFMTTSPINGALLRTAPPGAEASALAVAIFCIHLFGDLWAPSAVGLLADAVSLERALLLPPAALAAAAAVWWATARSST